MGFANVGIGFGLPVAYCRCSVGRVQQKTAAKPLNFKELQTILVLLDA